MSDRSTFLRVASNVYHDRASASLFPGLRSLAQTYVRDIGFRAEAYLVESTNEIVVAIAGTDPKSLPSLMNAGAIAFQSLSLPLHQVEAATAFIREVVAEFGTQYGPVTVVGHSSGGLVAQLIMAKQELERPEDQLPIDRAIGFNSPGAAPFLPALFGQNIPSSFDNIEAVCDSRDLVCRIFDD